MSINSKTLTKHGDGAAMDFPQGLARPHQARDWHRSLESAAADRDLTDVIRHRLPVGKFPKLHSDASLIIGVDEPGADASFKDKLSYVSRRDKCEERKKENEQILEQRADWWLKNNNQLFNLIVGTMVKTAPALRENLRDKFLVETGYYDGHAALAYVENHLTDLARRHPQYQLYETASHAIVSKRLPTGSSEIEFSAIARRFIFDVNPFTRSPLSGEILGEFIITKIMPDYPDAADRIVETLRERGELDDHEKVTDECAKAPPLPTAHAGSTASRCLRRRPR